MREVKFRAWDFQNNEMIQGVGITPKSDLTVPYKINPTPHNPEYLDYYPESALMQFTGLKDKNGRDIYEGDIVKGKAYEFVNAPRVIGEVIYDYCEFKVNSVREKTNRMKVELNTVYEVIGNVYEHPHLLE